MGAPGHGRVKCAHVHSCGDTADASDPHQIPPANLCLSSGDVSAQGAYDPRTCGRHRLQLQSRIPRLAFCGPGFLTPPLRRPCRRAALSGRGGGFVSVGQIVGPNNRGAADLHLPGQPLESLAALSASIDLWRNLLVLGHERVAGLPWFPAAAVNTARRPPPGAAQVKSVANDLSPDAERARDEIDARPRLGHLHDLRQHDLFFGGFRSATVTSRPRSPPLLGIVQRSPCRNSHTLSVGSSWPPSPERERRRSSASAGTALIVKRATIRGLASPSTRRDSPAPLALPPGPAPWNAPGQRWRRWCRRRRLAQASPPDVTPAALGSRSPARGPWSTPPAGGPPWKVWRSPPR